MGNERRKESKTFLHGGKRIWERCLEGMVDDCLPT